ncbi:hypothetical protein SAMN05216334_11127 [Nitrosomonas ureae]|uniref:Uncharacterized protein n=1 Tax=Nitrosomonas ureae TaxID=44577 RepID=A0A1H5V667_9PROT|nr:hypothetical protein SAMN05216334_11127 [Nitrosomonas ureae]
MVTRKQYTKEYKFDPINLALEMDTKLGGRIYISPEI